MAWPGIHWSLEAMQAMIIQQLVTTLASIQATPAVADPGGGARGAGAPPLAREFFYFI